MKANLLYRSLCKLLQSKRLLHPASLPLNSLPRKNLPAEELPGFAISLCALFVGIVIFAFAGCVPAGKSSRSAAGAASQALGPANYFTVPGQMVAADSIHSIQLSKIGSPGSAPILELNADEQLRLRFDILGFGSRQLQVSFSHHNPDWTRSSLPPEFFMEGFFTHYLDAGKLSRNQRLHYRQYTFDFPNEQVSLLRSGNYMLKVEDAQNGHLLFTLPFFVFENLGAIRSSVETKQVPRQHLRIGHRPVSYYQLPEAAEQPQFDLEFYYVQNQFWGRALNADEVDFADEKEVRFTMRTEKAFTGDYEFLNLPLNTLSSSNPRIFDADPARVPVRVQLYDDAQGFAAAGTNQAETGRYGLPDADLSASYADVFFLLDPAQSYPEDTEIYLVGDFNNWSVRAGNRLHYDADTGRWKTNQVIKQGTYTYKYVLLQNNTINDLEFDNQFSGGRQEYHAFVYMRDSQQFYYRLLQVNHFFKEF